MSSKTEVVLTLPWPPSVNNYYTRNKWGGVSINKKGKAYRARVAESVLLHGNPQIEGRVRITIRLHPPDNRKRDLDNTKKALLDAIQHAQVYSDDEQIDEDHTVRGTPIKDGAVLIRIEPRLEPPVKLGDPF
jgi:crossover junction endodeoxyribonuclease RusA